MGEYSSSTRYETSPVLSNGAVGLDILLMKMQGGDN
jgi:hypothetical protein